MRVGDLNLDLDILLDERYAARQTDGAFPGNRPSPNDRPAGPRFAALAEKRARSAQARTTGDKNERKGRQPTLPGEKTENP